MSNEQGSGVPASPNPDLHEVLPGKRTWLERALNVIKVVGNKLPDPAVLFFLLMIVVWVLSAVLAPIQFDAVHPSTGQPITVINQLAGDQMANFLVNMVSVFVNFAPLGIVLVALLGVGVAEHTGFVNAGLRKMLGVTSKSLLTPMVILVLPYFPLIVVFCRRYFRGSGIGTLISMMLPYAVVLAVAWTGFLLLYWTLGLPLGLQATYTYP